MDFLYSTQLSVPVFQLLILMLLSSLALLFNKPRVALFIYYLFAFYWGYILNLRDLLDAGTGKYFPFYYVGFGIFIVIITVLGFLHRKR